MQERGGGRFVMPKTQFDSHNRSFQGGCDNTAVGQRLSQSNTVTHYTTVILVVLLVIKTGIRWFHLGCFKLQMIQKFMNSIKEKTPTLCQTVQQWTFDWWPKGVPQGSWKNTLREPQLYFPAAKKVKASTTTSFTKCFLEVLLLSLTWLET